MTSAENHGPIVVGYDDSDASKSALLWAADQAELVGTEMIVVYVTSSAGEWLLASIEINPDPIRRSFEALLSGPWTEPLRARGTNYSTRLAVGRAAIEIMRIARSENARLIVIGMTGRGTLSELVSDNTQHTLRKHAARPVVAVPEVWNDTSQ